MNQFPLSQILDLLAMMKGAKPFSVKSAMKDVAGLIDFAADQLPDSPLPVKAAPDFYSADDSLVAGLEALSAHHDAHGTDPAKLKAFSFDWKSFASQLLQFAFSKLLPILAG